MLNSLNPNDISSITVLKDAKAVEKYGVAAKKGVIVDHYQVPEFFVLVQRPGRKKQENLRLNDLPSIAVTSVALDPLGNAAKNRKVL
jgi:hypothetical protein